jgi:peptide/nickel transport system ATP-binding protein
MSIHLSDAEKLIEVSSLSVDFPSGKETVSAVDNISFSINRGEIVALVGESGCGKSVTCLSLARLVDETAVRYASGTIKFYDKDTVVDILDLPQNKLRNIRGQKIAYIFQEPSTSLNPVMKIGEQLAESVMAHNNDDDLDVDVEVISLLKLVGIPEPEKRLNSYPCHLSGGMQQRVMIAMAIAGNPEILVADEPTTSLDVTIQAQIIELFRKIKDEKGMAILLVTHNLGIVADIADKVMVMYAGHIVESCSKQEIFTAPLHPYTMALLKAIPRLGRGRVRLESIPGVLHNYSKEYMGCRFAERCLRKSLADGESEICVREVPEERVIIPGHKCKCHYAHG